MDGRTQRKVGLAAVFGLVGVGFALVALAEHDGRQIVARWVLLSVIGFWRAGYLLRERNRPQVVARRWGEGS